MAFIGDPFYSSLFVGLGMILILLEIFIPSHGILTLFAAASAGLGVYGFFVQDNPAAAVGALVALVVFAVLALRFAVRRLRLIASLPPEVCHSIDEAIPGLDGKEGVAVTPLRPAGLARIDGKRVDVVATGTFIDRDSRIRVVETSGNRVVVREIPNEQV